MDTGTIILLCILCALLFVAVWEWIIGIPAYLRRIAVALEKIANKKEG